MRSIYIIILSLFTFVSHAQSIDDVIKTIPGNLLPGLDESNRILLLGNTTESSITYALGNIEKLQHTDSYIELKTSSVGSVQIKLLTLINNSKIICLIRTICGKGCDSRISFYSTEWVELESSTMLDTPSAEAFFDSSKKETDNYNFALSLPHIFPISARFVDGSDDLTLTFDYAAAVSPEMIDEIKPFIKSDTIVLRWNKTRFK